MPGHKRNKDSWGEMYQLIFICEVYKCMIQEISSVNRINLQGLDQKDNNNLNLNWTLNNKSILEVKKQKDPWEIKYLK